MKLLRYGALGQEKPALLDAKGVDFTEVLAELDRRDGVSGIAEKASRSE